MKLIFIRHGQTTGDVEDRYGGTYDDALSPEGEAQAATLAQTLASKGVGQILSSPLLRARQTAATLAKACGAPIEVVENLKERNQYGPLSGMVKAEAKRQHPELVEQVKDRLNTLPGAESYEAFRQRLTEVFQEIISKNAPSCRAIVWHGGGMRVLFRDILGWGELTSIGDCCWVELEGSGTTWRLVASSGLEFAFKQP